MLGYSETHDRFTFSDTFVCHITAIWNLRSTQVDVNSWYGEYQDHAVPQRRLSDSDDKF
jgi:hypothetical protein